MNKVDEHVRESIAAYPMLYSNRFDVLHRLFCVIGNGFEWVNGEPVDELEVERQPWRPEDEYESLSRYAHITPDWVDLMFEQIAENQAVIDTLDERVADFSFENSRQALSAVNMAKVMGPGYGPLYTQSKYALLMNLPTDIDPEWAAAAAEMRAVAETMNWKF